MNIDDVEAAYASAVLGSDEPDAMWVSTPQGTFGVYKGGVITIMVDSGEIELSGDDKQKALDALAVHFGITP